VEFDVCDLIHAETLFIGEVIEGGITSVRQDPWHTLVTRVRFRVIERFRGAPANGETVDLELIHLPGMCAPVPYVMGKRYLVAPATQNGKLLDGTCFNSRDAERHASDVEIVRAHFKGKTFRKIRGRVAAANKLEFDEYDFRAGGLKPLAGVRITATRRGRSVSAVSDSEGAYALDLPARGEYTVRLDIPPYTPQDDLEITLPQRGCITRNFSFVSGSTISGTVRDARGQLAGGARVGLIDLDAPHKVIARESTHGDGTFLFPHVPIGRFLVVSNPEGPLPAEIFGRGHPYARTYYPAGAGREAARPIEIRAPGQQVTGIDLLIGKPTAFRQVTIRVRFPDGAPMQTAHVRATAPLDQGEPPWSIETIADKNGELTFSAPVDLKLRIDVKDQYGRGESLSSEHEPGAQPIVREFVVRDILSP
jgi:hypothetical protein